MVHFSDKEEIEKQNKLLALMGDWEKTASAVRPNMYFVYDGFFPGYYSAARKVLFIAREPKDQETQDYIYNGMEFFKKGAVKSRAYWKRIVFMYGIIMNNGVIDESITADEIVKPMIESNNYGFAAINITKYLNDSPNNQNYDPVLMGNFLKDSQLDKRNFIEEEIAILDPDLIISGNIWDCGINDYLDKYLGKKTDLNNNVMVGPRTAALLYELAMKNKTVKVMDFYHFSARFADMDYWYKPLSILLKNVM